MKKFDRLPPEQRKEEIQSAAIRLFAEKGFAATTMENIVQNVSLSKGGVYRIYPSTSAILIDLILKGMRLRNEFYAEGVRKALNEKKPLTLRFMTDLICDSLLIHPELSAVYVEFLWAKRRSPELEALYQNICKTTMEETAALIRGCGAEDFFLAENISFGALTELMNTAILGLNVLNLQEPFRQNKTLISALMAEGLSKMN